MIENMNTPASNSKNVLNSDVELKGALKFTGELTFDGKLDGDFWGKLTETSDQPVLIEYTLTEDDVKGPFVKKLPSKLEDLQELDHLGYASAREAVHLLKGVDRVEHATVERSTRGRCVVQAP